MTEEKNIDRQFIIEEFINIETIISSLITAYYFPGNALKLEFLHGVLYDPLCTFRFKINILKKCYPEISKKIIENLGRLARVRNIFVHCGLDFTSFVDPEFSGVLDPKDKNKLLDFVQLKNDFIKIKSETQPELDKLLESRHVELKD